MKKIYLLMLGVLLSAGNLSLISAHNFYLKSLLFDILPDHEVITVSDVNYSDDLNTFYKKAAEALNKKLESDFSPDEIKLISHGKQLPRTSDKTIQDFELHLTESIYIGLDQ